MDGKAPSNSCQCIINNYRMRLSMIARTIKAEVFVICRSRRLLNYFDVDDTLENV